MSETTNPESEPAGAAAEQPEPQPVAVPAPQRTADRDTQPLQPAVVPAHQHRERKPWYRRRWFGETVHFVLLAIIFLIVVIGISAARPLIFDRIIPVILGWDVASQPPAVTIPQDDAVIPTETEEDAAPPAGETDAAPAEEADEAAEPAAAGEETDAAPPAGETDIAPAGETDVAPAQPTTHTVQQGENLTIIANQYGTTVQAIIEANNITNPDRIRPGDVLTIPEPEATP